MVTDYQLLYEIVYLSKQPIFIGLTNLGELYDLSEIEIPFYLNGVPIECRFIVLDKEGGYVDSYYSNCLSADVKKVCKDIPLILYNKYI